MDKIDNKQNEDILIDFRIAMVIATTFCLFVVCTLIMVGCLIGNAVSDNRGRKDEYSSNISQTNKTPSTDTSSDIPVSGEIKVGVKSGLMLPSATVAGTYVSTTSADVVDVSADTSIKSGHTILVELTGNSSVAEKGADVKIYPASMTKVMTLLVACENARDPNARITVTQEMVQYQQEMGASGIMGFSAGESVTVEDALFLVNYNSDTIACLMLAEYVAGGEAEFVELMNKKARDIGLTGTNFVNCTGLYDAEHYTTCREMAAIMACALQNEAARKVLTSYKGYTVDIYSSATATSSRTSTTYAAWYSGRLGDNAWAGNGSDVKIIGGKTGYEDIPTYCFVTAGKNTETGTEYVCVTVGRSDKDQPKVTEKQNTNDTKVLYQKYATK